MSENHRLEFKAKDILKNPAKVGREVVGFLNADGGEIWIGIQEKEGIAVSVEDISNPEKELGALRDHLMATIEPPIQTELQFEIVKGPDGEALIKVVIQKGTGGPYAQIDRGRHFLIRVTDRLREMSRQEIERSFHQASASSGEARVNETIQSIQKEQAAQTEKKPPRLWIRIQPVVPIHLALEDELVKAQFKTWLTDARSTGNRLGGFNFAIRHLEPRPRQTEISIGDPKIPYYTTVTDQGTLTYVKADGLYPLFREEDERIISVYALLEQPVSLFRFMQQILKTYGGSQSTQIVAAIAINGLRGARLVPGSPKESFLPWHEPKVLEKDALEIGPLTFGSQEIVNQPDSCGMRLVRRVYYEFDFDDHALPSEYDPKTGTLLLA
jgi:hypothetical protein